MSTLSTMNRLNLSQESANFAKQEPQHSRQKDISLTAVRQRC